MQRSERVVKYYSKNQVYKTALSIGWNPQFKNKEKTVEAYLVNEFPEDFYGTTQAFTKAF